jgi:parvulin-like peptidyl-prolyl isomerase
MNTRRVVFPALVLPALIACAGCELPNRVRGFLRGEEQNTAAVQVGNTLYSTSDLDRFFDSRLSEFRSPGEADKVKSNLLESFIEEKLLLAEAEQLNIQPNPQALRAMLQRMAEPADDRDGASDPNRRAELERSIANNLKVRQYLHDYLLRDATISDDECEAYYKQHLEDYVRNDVVRLREILVDEPALAQKIQGLLAATRNKNFGELARMYSKAASAGDGGELGTFQRGDLPDEFERVVFSLTPGTASKIVRTKYGYHTFLVEERIPAHQQKFWEVKDEIKEKLLLDREREIINRQLAHLMNQIPVEIHRHRLSFNYIGNRFSSNKR